MTASKQLEVRFCCHTSLQLINQRSGIYCHMTAASLLEEEVKPTNEFLLSQGSDAIPPEEIPCCHMTACLAVCLTHLEKLVPEMSMMVIGSRFLY